jgi:hypothetical protein
MIIRIADSYNSSPQTFILGNVLSPPLVTVAPTIKAYVTVGHLHNFYLSGSTGTVFTSLFSPAPIFTLP